MIATISAIAEEKKVRGDHSDHNGNHLPAIVRWVKFYLSDRCRCDRYDRWKVVSIIMIAMIAGLIFFAIAAIIWKSGFNF